MGVRRRQPQNRLHAHQSCRSRRSRRSSVRWELLCRLRQKKIWAFFRPKGEKKWRKRGFFKSQRQFFKILAFFFKSHRQFLKFWTFFLSRTGNF